MVIAVPLIAAGSFAAKFNGGAVAGTGSMQPLRVIAGYTWGNGGAGGEGLTTGRALSAAWRLLIGIGLLPLWLVFLYAPSCAASGAGAGLATMLRLLCTTARCGYQPLGTGFGHHPCDGRARRWWWGWFSRWWKEDGFHHEVARRPRFRKHRLRH